MPWVQIRNAEVKHWVANAPDEKGAAKKLPCRSTAAPPVFVYPCTPVTEELLRRCKRCGVLRDSGWDVENDGPFPWNDKSAS